MQVRTLESTFKGRSTSSSKDVTTLTSKNSISSEEEETVPPTTTVAPPWASKDPEKVLEKKKKKNRKHQDNRPFQILRHTQTLHLVNHPPISTPPPASKQVAKVTDVYHLTNLAYDISTVIFPRDTAEDDNLLTLSNL